MPPDLEKKLYEEGITLFNDHEYFEAHEVWEDIWHMAYGLKHSFYQGLIQCAVALEHYRRSNPRGVQSLYRSYQTKFKDIPKTFMGLDVPNFLAEMHATLSPVVDAPTLPAQGSVTLHLSTTPKISLLYNPFENGEAQKYDRPEKF